MQAAANDLHASNALNASSATAILQSGLAAVAAGSTEFDMSGYTVVDSVAVTVMIAWQRAAAALGKTAVFHGVQDNLRSLITLYGVADLLALDGKERH
ncbi:STAS domain-containing protein [Undibacterium sp. TJN25]|uniref:STAS domain-containing protein n=1 Tax=Undibacterium sp. TJN25 TaxID=3413056 RepID=UPI003BF44748